MAEVFFTVIAAVFVVSLVSLIGIFALSLKQAFLNRILFFLVSFAAGTLLGAAFLDLLPEALESGERLGVEASEIFLFVVAGVLAFFAMEKFLHWYHCHKGKCDVHTFHY
ncbi:MAG: ZIP family metal transporter, partial [Candidatus Micrarchaeia archaeon]